MPDPYNDGIGIVFEFAHPLDQACLELGRCLLEQWMDHYEDGEERLYRNCGLEGEIGGSRLTLWADRIRVEAEDAQKVATSVGRQGTEDLGALRWFVETADAASEADLGRRLGRGTPVRGGWSGRLRSCFFRE